MGRHDPSGESSGAAVGAAMASEAAAAPAPGTASQPSSRTLTVVKDSRRDKRLISVSTRTEPDLLRAQEDQFYCLNLETEDLENVIDWARQVRHVEPFEERRVPVIIVIGPSRSLTPREVYLVNHELTPTGASFYERPENESSYDVAMNSLREKLERQYAPAESMDAWRHELEPLLSK